MSSRVRAARSARSPRNQSHVGRRDPSGGSLPMSPDGAHPRTCKDRAPSGESTREGTRLRRLTRPPGPQRRTYRGWPKRREGRTPSGRPSACAGAGRPPEGSSTTSGASGMARRRTFDAEGLGIAWAGRVRRGRRKSHVISLRSNQRPSAARLHARDATLVSLRRLLDAPPRSPPQGAAPRAPVSPCGVPACES
jgi:hypothetical protein